MTDHRAEILDQFTRQAEGFAGAAGVRDPEALGRILRMAEAGGDDTVLDVACGPGLVVCAYAPAVRHAIGIDITPAMLEQARRRQRELDLANVAWILGDGVRLPFPDAQFSIVNSRFALHHCPDPLAVLREMRRVCQPGGRVVVTDAAPAPEKVAAYNAMEKLRDPSHASALTLTEQCEMYRRVGLPPPRVECYRMAGRLEDLMGRSYPQAGDAGRVRALFRAALADDALDMAVREEAGEILYAFPVAIFAATVQ